MKFKMMYSFLNADLQLIEKELEAAIEADSTVLREASLHLLQSGGKRIRPVFVLLGAKFGNYDIHVVKHVAATLELIIRLPLYMMMLWMMRIYAGVGYHQVEMG